MNKIHKQKNKAWFGQVADARMDRKNYPAGPAAGKEMWQLYKRYFNQALAGKKNANILVLGATPEFRDLALTQGHNVVVVDFSLEMILKMSKVMTHQNDPRKILVRGNWLNTGYLKENYFDLATGSGITNNLLPENQDKFFNETRRLLKKGGYILLHDMVIAPRHKTKPLAEFIKDYKNKKIHWFDIFMDARFYSDLTIKCQPKKYLYDMEKFGRLLEKYYPQMPKELVLNLKKYRGKMIHTLLPEVMFKKRIGKYFKLLPTKQAKDYLFCDSLHHFIGKVEK